MAGASLDAIRRVARAAQLVEQRRRDEAMSELDRIVIRRPASMPVRIGGLRPSA